MPVCAVYSCKNNSTVKNVKSSGISYHRFPVEPNIKGKWVVATAQPHSWVPTKSSSICSLHFKKDCYKFGKKKQLLKENAVPTLHLCNHVSKPCHGHGNADEADSPDSGGEGGGCHGREGACAACGGAAAGELGRRARGSPAEQFIEAAIFPRELNEKTLLCNDCYKTYCNEREQKDPKNPRKSLQSKVSLRRVALSEESTNVNVSALPTSDVLAAPQQTITLPNYKRALGSSEGCIFPNCQMKRLHIIPRYVKQCLLRDYKLYTSEHTLVCKQHLLSKKWKPLLNNAKLDFTVQHIEDAISTLTTNVTGLNFDNIEDIPPNLLIYSTGINHKQLQKILDQLPLLAEKTKTPVLALSVYLTKLRTNDSFDRLSTLFQTKKHILEKLTTVAKDCMLKKFISVHSKVPSASDETEITSGVIADDQILHYLQEHYYGDVPTTKEHTVLETLASLKTSQRRKRNHNSNSEDDSQALEIKGKKRPIEETVKTNMSIKKESGQYDVSEVAVEFESLDRAEFEAVSESMENEEKSTQPRVKEEPRGEVSEREPMETEDENLVFAPEPIKDLQVDPLDLDAVPALLGQVKSEEGSITIKVELVEEDAQEAQSTNLHPEKDQRVT